MLVDDVQSVLDVRAWRNPETKAIVTFESRPQRRILIFCEHKEGTFPPRVMQLNEVVLAIVSGRNTSEIGPQLERAMFAAYSARLNTHSAMKSQLTFTVGGVRVSVDSGDQSAVIKATATDLN
jgi:hypothetical protein